MTCFNKKEEQIEKSPVTDSEIQPRQNTGFSLNKTLTKNSGFAHSPQHDDEQTQRHDVVAPGRVAPVRIELAHEDGVCSDRVCASPSPRGATAREAEAHQRVVAVELRGDNTLQCI